MAVADDPELPLHPHRQHDPIHLEADLARIEQGRRRQRIHARDQGVDGVARLGRHMGRRGPDHMDRRGLLAVARQYRFQLPAQHIVRDQPARQPGQAHASDGGIGHGLEVVHQQRRNQPGTVWGVAAIGDTSVAGEVVDRFNWPHTLQIRRRSRQAHGLFTQAARAEAVGVGQRADSHGHVEAFLGQIHQPVGEANLDFQLWITRHQTPQCGRRVVMSECQRQTHP